MAALNILGPEYRSAGPGGRYIQIASMIRELIGKFFRQASRVRSSLEFLVAKGIKIYGTVNYVDCGVPISREYPPDE